MPPFLPLLIYSSTRTTHSSTPAIDVYIYLGHIVGIGTHSHTRTSRAQAQSAGLSSDSLLYVSTHVLHIVWPHARSVWGWTKISKHTFTVVESEGGAWGEEWGRVGGRMGRRSIGSVAGFCKD